MDHILVWSAGNLIPTISFSNGSSSPSSVFVSINGDVFIANTNLTKSVEKWSPYATNSTTVLYPTEACSALFVDIFDCLYCSMTQKHQVIKQSLATYVKTITIAAGTGTNGSASNMLSDPWGIHVDAEFNLYVADCGNNRIQLFPRGQLNGTTVAGYGSLSTITLSCPTDVTLDGNGYLLIVDSHNHRIVGSGPNGFRCLVGCAGTSGTAADQLSSPTRLSVDSRGNLYVIDQNNLRIQKFSLSSNSCGE